MSLSDIFVKLNQFKEFLPYPGNRREKCSLDFILFETKNQQPRRTKDTEREKCKQTKTSDADRFVRRRAMSLARVDFPAAACAK